VIIATAGHVDHGKTSLIRALTGVDTDALPEEKRRGMSIDLGFAYLALPGTEREPLGFVDVPGHLDFIRNTLAGLAAADAALLVVAADDGPMPQTLEHLCALELLGMSVSAVAITKIDRADAAAAARCVDAVRHALPASSCAPFFRVSAVTGEGIADLKEHLLAQGAALAQRSTAGNFRLAVDRCFSVSGAGLVVTGMVASGRLSVGDSVRVLGAQQDARVRGLRVHGAEASACRAGQRVALNLAGPDLRRHEILRGDWVTTGAVPPPQRRIDARLRVHASCARALEHWSAVQVHLGAAHATARIAVLEGARIEPGADALVQLVLDQPLAAVAGDRFLVRDAARRATLGGGQVIDVLPPPRGRARPSRLAQLRALETPCAAPCLQAVLEATPEGVALEPFRQSRNLTPSEADAVFDAVPATRVSTARGPLAFSPLRWRELADAVLRNLAATHESSPGLLGPPADRILQGSGASLPRDVVLAIADRLAKEGLVRKHGMVVSLPSHAPRLDAADQLLWEKARPLLAAGGQRPPGVFELSYALRVPAQRVESVLGRAAQCGLAVRVSARHYYLPDALAALGAMAERANASVQGPGFTAAAFRDCSGLGRNLAIEVLEYFDRVRYTRRIGDRHIVLATAATVFSEGQP
jgi:selenocysteine-specific elongation factor